MSKKKILIVTQYFYPENFKSNDLAFELQRRNYDITVLTGIPNYPEGKFFDNYGFFKNRNQNINNVKIIRSILLPRGNSSGIKLFLNYYSFAFFASIKAFFLGFKYKYDYIIVHEPSPIMQFYPALLINKFWKTPIFFWVMDLWPESLSVAGGIKNKFVLIYYERLVRKFYNKSKKILVTSKGFKNSINEKGNFEGKIFYLPNWGEDCISNRNSDFKLPELPEGFKVMFAGNIGEAQDMENVMKVTYMLKENKKIKFIFIGSGRKQTYIEEFVKENNLQDTVFILGRFPVETMNSFFSMADVMLVSLKSDPIFNLTIPAKIQAYMSAGKPIIGMIDGEGASIIKEANAGDCVPSGDYISLVKTIVEMSEFDKTEIEKLCFNSKNYYFENFTLSKCIDSLETILN